LGFRAQGEIGNDYIATRFQETESEGKRDTAATACDQSSLAIEIAEKHADVGVKFGVKCELIVNGTGRDNRKGQRSKSLYGATSSTNQTAV